MKKEINLPFLPPSLNEIKTVIRGQIRSSKVGTKYRREVRECLSLLGLKKFGEQYTEKGVRIDYTFFTPKLFTKKGFISQNSKDVDNLIKVINDEIFNALGIDDCQVIDMTIKKRKGKERTNIVITYYKGEDQWA